ncbi:two-component sensor histidine kinase [Actinoplanes ianthinogenes]|uniref:histidine kinase n=1 Tax=Actinoplanes ianthinogenes TaxID=122358 RepID=A0ABN6CB04_9ACTN|nr:HAMP domain-containing sensor histidine kinase [Actinoplanes ianthinogenes]BCJ42719.1 two-component sensor histidine kinase [Actinoplanes ianthinogenes]GGQ92668.1 two-component sensor histidine kinase [Actinoplanes ianthinogenes]
MTISERVRVSLPPQASLRKVSLRTKLVASVLVLVFAALTLISSASTIALHTYMVNQLDTQLRDTYKDLGALAQADFKVYMPMDWMIGFTSVSGSGTWVKGFRTVEDDLPPALTSVEAVQEHADKPFTVSSRNGKYVWRVLAEVTDSGSVVYVGARMTGVNGVIARLIWADVLVGVGVLLALAIVGAALVRQSLVPLLQIERTAGRIAAGDYSQRVPDPEVDGGEPTTELGRLSSALNAMLAQIEAAFLARAASERQAMEAAAAAQASESRAVRSEEKMRQFVADASHELRTPLTSIRGFAELYRQGAVSDPEAVARLVRRIEDEAARMGLLVEDLLLLARLDRERPINLAPVELPVLAMDAVQAAQATAPDRVIELEVLADHERLVALGDDARLRQVIGNLMTNALVHTPPDATVTLRLRAEGENHAVVEVSDTGAGLTPEQRAHVFERFYRVDGARTRNTAREATGTGLGLAIVAALVRSHNGTVDVVSEPGEGATFRVTLPTINPDKGFTENIQD